MTVVCSTLESSGVGSVGLVVLAPFSSVPGVPGAMTLMVLRTSCPAAMVPSPHVTVMRPLVSVLLVQSVGKGPSRVTPSGSVSVIRTLAAYAAPAALLTRRM